MMVRENGGFSDGSFESYARSDKSMIVHGRGLICVLATQSAWQTWYSSMVPHNQEAQKTDFTVSVDAADGMLR